MNWLQKNNYILVLFTAFVFVVAFLLFTDNGDTSYKHIDIQHGDSLWSLAEQYKGSMSTNEWIKAVKIENDLKDNEIVAGHKLSIPISEDEIYVAQNLEEEKNESVKVANNN